MLPELHPMLRSLHGGDTASSHLGSMFVEERQLHAVVEAKLLYELLLRPSHLYLDLREKFIPNIRQRMHRPQPAEADENEVMANARVLAVAGVPWRPNAPRRH